VHTSTPQLKGRVRAMYTSVYTASTQSCTWQVGLHGRIHGPRRHVTAVGRVHGRNAPCTRSCSRPIHSRVHGPYAVMGRTRPWRAVWERVHGPVGLPAVYTAQTALVHGRVTAEYTVRYRAVYALCRRPKTAVYTASVHGRAHGPYTAVYTSRYGPYTAVYTTRYTAVYGRVDGRFRPSRWPVHDRVHGPCTRRHMYAAVYVSCTRPCARPVHSRVHVPCTGPCTLAETGRRLSCRRPVHSHVHGWCRRAVCTAHSRPCTRPCTRRV